MAERSIDDRIRDKAYELWMAEGQPHGRDEAHWEQAREMVAVEDSQRATLLPRSSGAGEPVEPPEAYENQGEFPALTDQGDSERGPTRRATRRTSRSATNPGESVATSLPLDAGGTVEEGKKKGKGGEKAKKAKDAGKETGAEKGAAASAALTAAEADTRPKRGRPAKVGASDVRH